MHRPSSTATPRSRPGCLTKRWSRTGRGLPSRCASSACAGRATGPARSHPRPFEVNNGLRRRLPNRSTASGRLVHVLRDDRRRGTGNPARTSSHVIRADRPRPRDESGALNRHPAALEVPQIRIRSCTAHPSAVSPSFFTTAPSRRPAARPDGKSRRLRQPGRRARDHTAAAAPATRSPPRDARWTTRRAGPRPRSSRGRHGRALEQPHALQEDRPARTRVGDESGPR